MRILELFCGEGIAARGLEKFGETTGYDTQDFSENYPGRFIQGDWRTPFEDGTYKDYDFIWASPPCQCFSKTKYFHNYKMEQKYPDLVNPVREALYNSGKPFVIENVTQAPIRQDLKLCGCMVNLPVRRIRAFEHNFQVPQPEHKEDCRKRHIWTVVGHFKGTKDEWKRAMGVDLDANVSKKGLAQGVPTGYVLYIMGHYLIWRDSLVPAEKLQYMKAVKNFYICERRGDTLPM